MQGMGGIDGMGEEDMLAMMMGMGLGDGKSGM